MAQNLTVKSPGPDGAKTPPGGWSVFIPEIPAEQKRVFTHKFLHLLKPLVEKAIKKAGLKITDVDARIQRHTAHRLVREGHNEWVNGLVRRKRALAEHFKGTLAYATVVAREKAGRPVLTLQADAERRAATCAGGAPGGKPCEMNILTEGESKVEQAEEAAIAAKVDDRTTNYDDLVGKCDACSCQLRTIVHLMPDIVTLGLTEKEWKKHPSYCWKHQFRK
jgi:hypothetical protein